MGSESKEGVDVLQIDETYEFCAPRFFDFMNDESEEEEQEQGPAQSNNERDDTTTAAEKTRGAQDLIAAAGQQQEIKEGKMSFVFVPDVKPCDTNLPLKEDESSTTYTRSKEIAFAFPIQPSTNMVAAPVKGKGRGHSSSKKLGASEVCTPRAQRVSPKGLAAPNTCGTEHFDLLFVVASFEFHSYVEPLITFDYPASNALCAVLGCRLCFTACCFDNLFHLCLLHPFCLMQEGSLRKPKKL